MTLAEKPTVCDFSYYGFEAMSPTIVRWVACKVRIAAIQGQSIGCQQTGKILEADVGLSQLIDE